MSRQQRIPEAQQKWIQGGVIVLCAMGLGFLFMAIMSVGIPRYASFFGVIMALTGAGIFYWEKVARKHAMEVKEL